MIGLSEEDEPAIYATTKMESTILENVILDADGIPNFHDSTLTQNTRASYPIDSIENRTEDSTAGHPKNVVFLTCDAFGVLPPISRLSLHRLRIILFPDIPLKLQVPRLE